VLYQGIDRSQMTPFKYVMHYADHIVPAGMVLVDFILNRVPFMPRHLWVIVTILMLYGVDNIAVSLIRDKPIYAPIDPKKPLSYVIGLALPILSSLAFLMYVKIVEWKLRNYEASDRMKSMHRFASMNNGPRESPKLKEMPPQHRI
jgi:hypothetical protein